MPRPRPIYAEAFGRDPQFAQFYRSLEAYKASFNKKGDVMVVDPQARSSSRPSAWRSGGAARAAPAARPRRSNLDSDLFWSALALVLVLEGLFPFSRPGGWRRTFQQLLQLRDGQLRFFGLCSLRWAWASCCSSGPGRLAGRSAWPLAVSAGDLRKTSASDPAHKLRRPAGLLGKIPFLTAPASHVRLGPAGSHRRCLAFRGPAHRRTAPRTARHGRAATATSW